MQCELQDLTDRYLCDFILSIGPHCRPATNLCLNFLRDFSSPLDWMMSYSLDTVLHLFQNNFNDFFEIYEVDENRKGATGHAKGAMRRVVDTKNHIISIHHFLESMTMTASYPMFKEKMDKRAKNLEKKLTEAKRVVLISDRPDSIDELTGFLKSFSEMYPHLNIRLINMRHDEKLDYESYNEELIYEDEKLSYIEYSLNDTQQGILVPEGNAYVWSRILSNYATNLFVQAYKNWLEYRNNSCQIVIYGAGRRCIKTLNFFDNIGIQADGIAVTSLTDNPTEINKVKVKMFSQYSKDSSFLISLANVEDAMKINDMLRNRGYTNIARIDDNLNIVACS